MGFLVTTRTLPHIRFQAVFKTNSALALGLVNVLRGQELQVQVPPIGHADI